MLSWARGRGGEDGSTVLDAPVSNQLMQGLGRQVRPDSFDVRCVEHAREAILDRTVVDVGAGFALSMDRRGGR